MLCHKGTLNVGFAHGVEHGSQAFGTQAGDVCHLRRQIQIAGLGVIELLHGLVQHAGFPVHNAVVAGAFVASTVSLPKISSCFSPMGVMVSGSISTP